MSGRCCGTPSVAPRDTWAGRRFRRALWIALAVNAAMFGVELGAGLQSGSVSLLADAIDFFGDSANYLMSLVVMSMGLMWRARGAWIKGMTMVLFGLLVLARAAWGVMLRELPEPLVMSGIGVLAFLANLGVALMLYRFRDGDADMRSVWLCSRNDAIGNLAVISAAAGVFGTGDAWPDLVVAVIMAGLALSSGIGILTHARRDMQRAKVEAGI
ncbi:cation transporter [Marinobacterium sp. D7]|uniref:cation transporter n=1 Tax=Marinobacterium ramblicola TaxID=2849041 RepID=UPI001C2CD515|nr:cation transporter [Marinobacterium ramblicola]MBV1790417.1 cation transporter [Marinobacterium ramblicola]